MIESTENILESSWKSLLNSGSLLRIDEQEATEEDNSTAKFLYLTGMHDLSKLLFWHCENHDVTGMLTPDKIKNHIMHCHGIIRDKR